MKLQRYMSHEGICSRRQAELLIADGAVQVNGVVAHVGQVIDPEKDTVTYSDEIKQKKFVYYKYNKPTDIVTSCPQEGEKCIKDVLQIPSDVFPLGRLDKDTTGLILLTNNTQLQTYLMHDNVCIEKEYEVTTFKPVEDRILEQLEKGVQIMGETTQPAKIQRIDATKFRIIITEGKNRQIRRMCRAVAHHVRKLQRIRIGEIHLATVPLGTYIPLEPEEQLRCEKLLQKK